MTYYGDAGKGMSSETYEALRRERELRLAPMPGAQVVSGGGAAGTGSETPAWVFPLALLGAGFLVTFALTRRG